MDIQEQWPDIRRQFHRLHRGAVDASLATVNPDGTPHVTPIGSLVLLAECRGIYWEHFPRRLPANLAHGQRVCILLVNHRPMFWLKSLWRGRFDSPPAIRLLARAGARREATREEMALWHRRIRPFRRFKGYRLLWSDLTDVRELTFERLLPVSTGAMTAKPASIG